jgi:basic membrane protein A
MTPTAPARALLLAAALFSFAGSAHADAPLTVGVLIPGSKSDKGWMESGYDGLERSEAKHGAKVKVSFVENVKFADMEQALTMLATKNQLVIGVGGQTEASVRKVARRFPKVKFSVVGGNKGSQDKNVAQYDVRQAEIAFVAGAAAAMLSKNGAVSYVGGLEIPAIVNAGKEFGNGARYVDPKIKYFESYTGDFDDVAKSKEATLAAIAQGADVHYYILNLGRA